MVYPNFNHGVYMAEHLASLLAPGGRVAVVGGPDVVDDIELLLGIRHGLDASGLVTVNDPEDPRYKNTTDVASGGKEKTANLLADFDQLDGLVPFNDETLLGAVEALRDAGRLGEVKMVSRNGTPAAIELVKAGIHGGTWDIDPLGIGATIADLALRGAGGEDPGRALRRQPCRPHDHRRTRCQLDSVARANPLPRPVAVLARKICAGLRPPFHRPVRPPLQRGFSGIPALAGIVGASRGRPGSVVSVIPCRASASCEESMERGAPAVLAGALCCALATAAIAGPATAVTVASGVKAPAVTAMLVADASPPAGSGRPSRYRDWRR